MTSVDAPPADLLDPAWWPDLDRVHEFFTWARREAPVYRDANGYWIVTRHADVLDVERRSAVFSSKGSYRANITTDESNMIAQDDPEHLAQRHLVSRRFTPRAVQQDERVPRRAGSTSCSTRWPTPAQIEVVHGLAAQLPSRLTADLLGFPEDRWEDIKSWSERLMRTDAMLRDPEAAMGMMSAIMEFNPLLEEISAERKGCPMDDLISVWTEAGYDPMTMMHETGPVHRRWRRDHAHRHRPRVWRSSPSTPTSGRRPPPTRRSCRAWWRRSSGGSRRSTTCSGRSPTTTTSATKPVAAGDRVMLAYPSANRDEDVFDEPFAFDIRRDPNPHLAFGQGTHFCVGANLARLELRLLFGALTQRWTNLRIVTPPDIEPNIFAGAVRRFDLAFELR